MPGRTRPLVCFTLFIAISTGAVACGDGPGPVDPAHVYDPAGAVVVRVN